MSRKKNPNDIVFFTCICGEPVLQDDAFKMICGCGREYKNFFNSTGDHFAYMSYHENEELHMKEEGRLCKMIEEPLDDFKIVFTI